MKRYLVPVSFACLCAAVLAMPVRAAEMRGLWVDAFHPGIKTSEQTSALVAKAKECNFNALFVQVRKRGDVYYKSSIEPMAVDVAPEYDPLADVIRQAHAAGMEVHAWVTAYECYHPVKWRKENLELVHATHPEWLTKDQAGKTLLPGDRRFLDPGLKEVQDYLVSIAVEVASNYQVDGIHLEGIRYPFRESGYNSAALERFNKESGVSGKPKPDDKQWCAWRCDQVTNLVRLAYGAVTKVKPEVKVSASAFADPQIARDQCLQDWGAWIEEGILDFAVPMIYEQDNRAYAQVVARCLTAGRARRHVYIGQAGWMMEANKSVERIGMVRNAGAPGTVVFSYWYCTQPIGGAASGLLNALKAGPYTKPDTTPAMSWKNRK